MALFYAVAALIPGYQDAFLFFTIALKCLFSEALISGDYSFS
ncbi:hypothetical protein SARI_03218 [Salmonella enterica subsp. arizonae serovar 62:z4,z23:-]|uniref:Uncharacterized protein n=1 Tax=Salmonella arizonae (strain ATCC BAA-731 / CDC346-86 / RSK2980) TaxID=41514 RepID=A9MEY8_SALAR|nr:hypothetical protein SARI_03218 [Salmonella enterica subsp. arizonae serovar 62:z4,z23:-]